MLQFWSECRFSEVQEGNRRRQLFVKKMIDFHAEEVQLTILKSLFSSFMRTSWRLSRCQGNFALCSQVATQASNDGQRVLAPKRGRCVLLRGGPLIHPPAVTSARGVCMTWEKSPKPRDI